MYVLCYYTISFVLRSNSIGYWWSCLVFFSLCEYSNKPGPTPGHLLPLPSAVAREAEERPSLKRKLLEATDSSGLAKKLVFDWSYYLYGPACSLLVSCTACCILIPFVCLPRTSPMEKEDGRSRRRSTEDMRAQDTDTHTDGRVCVRLCLFFSDVSFPLSNPQWWYWRRRRRVSGRRIGRDT